MKRYITTNFSFSDPTTEDTTTMDLVTGTVLNSGTGCVSYSKIWLVIESMLLFAVLFVDRI